MELVLRRVFGLDFERLRSLRWDFPFPEVSGFTGFCWHQKGYGLEKVVSTGTPRAYL
ncbi:MAG: hypothetical protein JWQ42_1723 [Edaphobacter sp.]|nr:hypothetical protein [Edaphobacter sp.]